MQAFEVEQQGCRLAATVSGSGPRVVFIQGVGLHGDGWLPQVSWLDRAFACMRFDNRGIGKSQPLGSALSVERMAEDVRARRMLRVGTTRSSLGTRWVPWSRWSWPWARPVGYGAVVRDRGGV